MPLDVSSPKPVNVAVIGLGFMGVTHLRAYLQLPGARIAAVCDRSRGLVDGVLAGVAGNISQSGNLHLGPNVKTCRLLEEVLEDPEIDLIDLCTPTPRHAEQAITALQAGKHVLCEKPLARTSAAATELLQIARASKGFLMPAMCMRFWPGWDWLKQAVDERRFGRVLAARFRRVSARPTWNQATYLRGEDTGGALFDLHIHDTDFIHHLFGRPGGVYSSGATDASGAITHVFTQYHYADGPAVCAEGSWLLPEGFNMAYSLHCERATVDFDLARGVDALRITEIGQPPRVEPLGELDGYGAEIRYFVECIANNRPPRTVTALDGVTALQICEAEEQSIRTGKIVTL